VPYLPIDPHHLGRSYEAVIRVNSQSGKGGVAYIMKFEHGLDLPRRLQIEFSSVIQKLTEASGTEISADQIWTAFESTYLTTMLPVTLVGHPMITTAPDSGATTLETAVRLHGVERWIKGSGNGPIAAFVEALQRDGGITVELTDYNEHALGEGADARAAAYVEARVNGGKSRWGVGLDANIVTASLRAVISAVNR
jgi:2-isopropylmalate synthase